MAVFCVVFPLGSLKSLNDCDEDNLTPNKMKGTPKE